MIEIIQDNVEKHELFLSSIRDLIAYEEYRNIIDVDCLYKFYDVMSKYDIVEYISYGYDLHYFKIKNDKDLYHHIGCGEYRLLQKNYKKNKECE
jgi:hypothetical protein